MIRQGKSYLIPCHSRNLPLKDPLCKKGRWVRPYGERARVSLRSTAAGVGDANSLFIPVPKGTLLL